MEKKVFTSILGGTKLKGISNEKDLVILHNFIMKIKELLKTGGNEKKYNNQLFWVVSNVVVKSIVEEFVEFFIKNKSENQNKFSVALIMLSFYGIDFYHLEEFNKRSDFRKCKLIFHKLPVVVSGYIPATSIMSWVSSNKNSKNVPYGYEEILFDVFSDLYSLSGYEYLHD